MDQTSFYRGLQDAQSRLAAAPSAAPARAQAVHALVDAFVATRSHGGDGAAPWDCRAGCAHCCRHPVGVTFAEALLLASAIAALPAAQAAHLRERVLAAAAATAARSWSELATRPCPLLVDERCAVYAARPTPCRSFGSTSAAACAAPERHAGVPFDRAAFTHGLGATAALADTAGHRELRAALAAVLRATASGPATDADLRAAFAAGRPAGD